MYGMIDINQDGWIDGWRRGLAPMGRRRVMCSTTEFVLTERLVVNLIRAEREAVPYDGSIDLPTQIRDVKILPRARRRRARVV